MAEPIAAEQEMAFAELQPLTHADFWSDWRTFRRETFAAHDAREIIVSLGEKACVGFKFFSLERVRMSQPRTGLSFPLWVGPASIGDVRLFDIDTPQPPRHQGSANELLEALGYSRERGLLDETSRLQIGMAPLGEPKDTPRTDLTIAMPLGIVGMYEAYTGNSGATYHLAPLPVYTPRV